MTGGAEMEDNNTKKRLLEYNGIIMENDDIYREITRSFGLSECGFWILYLLRTVYRPLAQSEVCAHIYLPKQTVNSALKKMETDGYIGQIPGEDHRSKRIVLTDRGIRLCERTIDQVIEAEYQVFESLSEEEREAFLGLFHKYTGLLKTRMRVLSREYRAGDRPQTE